MDTSHFTGQGWNVGLKFRPKEAIDDKDVFIQNSAYRCSWRLREKYKKLTGKECCECCGLSEWQGKPLSLTKHYRGRAKKAE